MEDLTRNRVVIFTWGEFKKLLGEITYGTVDIECENREWFFTEANIMDETDLKMWKIWLEENGSSIEEARAELNKRLDEDEGMLIMADGEEFTYRMIGKKFNGIVKTMIADFSSDKVVVIFE
jgi:hypothetical protein